MTEDIPIYTMIKETTDNGYYDYGNGMYIKALVFELGGCSRGHPCALYTGSSQLPPDGCPLESQCAARWIGDPWRTYDSLCYETVTMDNLATQEALYKNITLLATEWFEYAGLDCLLRLNGDGSWTHEVEGVAIVLRAQGFTFPAQTVIVSDIDTVPDYESGRFPDIMQEASINFAMLGSSIVKPTNTHASDHFTAVELLDAPDILDPITVTLSQDYLNALDLGLTETTVDASIAGLTSDKIYNFPEFWYHNWQSLTAGGVVWADFASEFDSKCSRSAPSLSPSSCIDILTISSHSHDPALTYKAMVHSFALGKKLSTDNDQTLSLYPLTVNARCQCSKTTTTTMVIRPTATDLICKAHLVSLDAYTCDGTGAYYCNQVTRTMWDRSTPDNPDGTLGCTPRNSTKVILDVEVAVVPPPNFTWPANAPSPIPFPSNTPNASPSPSTSATPSPSPV